MSTDAQRTPLFSGTERRGILRDAIALISGSHVATACGVLQNLVVLAVIPPKLMGIWTTIRTILDYGNHSSLGVSRAAGIDIAVAAGQNDGARIRRLSDVTMTLELITAAIVAAGLIGGSVFHAIRGDIGWAAAFGIGAAIAVISRYYAFNLTVLRSVKKFPTLARARIFGAVCELVLFTAGAFFCGFYGMLGAALIAQLANAWFVRSDGGLQFGVNFDLPTTLTLLGTGWTLAAEALALTALRSVDRFVIIQCLANGDEQLGWYKIAIVMGAWAFDQSNLIANVIFPRLGETLGRTSDPAAVLRLGLRVAEVIALAMVLCSAALLVVGVPIVDRLLPAYRPGLIAAGGMVAAAAFLGISMPLRYALLTIGRTRSMLAVTALAAAVSLGAGIAILSGSADRLGAELGRISWNSAAAATVLLVATLLLCCVGRRELWGSAARVVGAGLYLAVGVMILQSLRGHTPTAVLLAAVWCLGPAWLLVSRVTWRDLLGKRKQTGSSDPDVPDVA